MLRVRTWLAAVAVALTLATTSLSAPGAAEAAGVDMQEGLWEITTRMEMPGMPSGMGAHTMQQCYTKKDIDDPQATIPKDPQAQCTMTDATQAGNTMTWTVRCTGERQVTGTGTMTYRGTSYDGAIAMQMMHGGQSMNMTQRIAARRVGACR